jgi:hypothetical protein
MEELICEKNQKLKISSQTPFTVSMKYSIQLYEKKYFSHVGFFPPEFPYLVSTANNYFLNAVFFSRTFLELH